jgi:YbbR domain-containing protein
MDKWLKNVNFIRIVAVMVAILLWVIVRLDFQSANTSAQLTTVTQKYLNVSIQTENLNGNQFIIRSLNPDKITLTIVGTASALRRVNIRDYQVVADLTNVVEGEQTVNLSARGFPSNVDVMIEPQAIQVTIDELQQKEIPVTINVTGNPADGYKVGEPVVEPNRVNVTVTSSSADEVASVIGNIIVRDATTTVNEQVRLIALDQDGEPIDVTITPAVVSVQVPITSPFKSVPLQITPIGATPPGLAVETFTSSVPAITIYGMQSTLDALQFYDGLSIDLTQLTEAKTYEFELDIPLKPDLERIEPDKVTVTVKVSLAVKRTFADLEITLNGQNEANEYRLLEPESSKLDIIVEAAADIASNLSSTNIRALVDVNNLQPGMHTLPINYNLPTMVEIAEGNLEFVQVEIIAKEIETN